MRAQPDCLVMSTSEKIKETYEGEFSPTEMASSRPLWKAKPSLTLASPSVLSYLPLPHEFDNIRHDVEVGSHGGKPEPGFTGSFCTLLLRARLSQTICRRQNINTRGNPKKYIHEEKEQKSLYKVGSAAVQSAYHCYDFGYTPNLQFTFQTASHFQTLLHTILIAQT